MKLIFIAVCGVAVILLLAYGPNAEFNVIQGHPISDAQEAVIAWLVLAARYSALQSGVGFSGVPKTPGTRVGGKTE
jgi:hypothetical protein